MTSRRVLRVGVLLIVASCLPPAKTEVCTNGLDDDANGQIDCLDSACASQAVCLGNQASCTESPCGSCPHCGEACTAQSQCLSDKLTKDRPPPMCAQGKCRQANASTYVSLTMRLDNGWALTQTNIRSVSVRFIKKLGVDGSSVSCATVEAASSASNSTAIEASGRFNIQGIDIYRVDNTMPVMGLAIPLPLLSTATGGDYLLWVDLWDQGVDSESTYPKGTRLGYACDDSATLTPVLPTDECPSTDGGACRRYLINVPFR